MIETLKYATIARIYVKNLRTYSEQSESADREFCRENGITHMPSQDLKSYYKLTPEGEFVHKELTDEVSISPAAFLFCNSTLKKFEPNSDDILFVVEEGKIKGVVHIVDYNSEFLFFEFFKLIYYFERNLRLLLIKKHDCKNEDIINELKLNTKYKRLSSKSLGAHSKLNAFFITELLEFSKIKEHFSKWNKDTINELRKWVAHNKDMIKIEKNETSNESLYNFKGLEKYIKDANTFFSYFEELESALKS